MTMHKEGALLLLILAGAISVALTGCKYSESATLQQSDEISNSGPLTIQKMGGEIDVQDARRGATLTTMGGDIHLGSVASFAKVKTMGGNIAIDHAKGPVNAATMGGKIDIAQASGSVEATTMAGNITARLVGTSSARRDISLSSNAGTILLTVPKDFPMDVRVTLAYTKNADKAYRIIESLGLSQHTTEEWDNSHGTPRKYIYAEGRVGSGMNHVEIKTINGDVILRQE